MSWVHVCLFLLSIGLPCISLFFAMNGLKKFLRNWSNRRLYMTTGIPVFKLQCREDSLYQVGQALERALGTPSSWRTERGTLSLGEFARKLRQAQKLFFLPQYLSPALLRRWGIPPADSIRYHLMGHSLVRVLDWKLFFDLLEQWGHSKGLDPRLVPSRGLRETLMRLSSEGLLPLQCCSEALAVLKDWLGDELRESQDFKGHQGKVISFPQSRSSY